MEPMSGVARFTFGSLDLAQGLELVPIAIGLFGVSELLAAAHDKLKVERPLPVRLRELLPTLAEWKRSRWPIIRGSVLGFLFGLIPGPTAIIATFSSYALERKLSKHPEEFGKGAIEGVAGPESANNGAAQGAFIPLLALGIPFAPASAMLLTALLIHGAQTGPLLMTNSPQRCVKSGVGWGQNKKAIEDDLGAIEFSGFDQIKSPVHHRVQLRTRESVLLSEIGHGLT
jgi:putative tricarboxylic transport membrane protein